MIHGAPKMRVPRSAISSTRNAPANHITKPETRRPASDISKTESFINIVDARVLDVPPALTDSRRRFTAEVSALMPAPLRTSATAPVPKIRVNNATASQRYGDSLPRLVKKPNITNGKPHSAARPFAV